MRKILLSALGLFLFFGPAGAVDKKGKIGAGFFNDDAPIGARYWVTDRFGIDLGFGINLRNLVDSTRDTNLLPLIALDPTKKTLVDFRFDAGLPINIARTEKVNFLIRPGLSFQGFPYFNPIISNRYRLDTVAVDTFTSTGDSFPTIIFDTLRSFLGTAVDTITEERSQSFDINLTLGIEYFPVENFSVSLFSGIGARSEKKTKNGQRVWTLTSRPFFKGANIGFRYYF